MKFLLINETVDFLLARMKKKRLKGVRRLEKENREKWEEKNSRESERKMRKYIQ